MKIQKSICYKISKWCNYQLDLENSNSAGNERIAFDFCSYLKLVSPNFLQFTTINLFKSYEKCFLFHLNCSYGSCNIQILEGNWKLKNGIIITSWNSLHILPVTYPEQFSYWYTNMTPKFRHQKMKYTFIYTFILHRRLYFLLLNLSKFYF